MIENDWFGELVKKRIRAMGISDKDVAISRIRSKAGVHVFKLVIEGVSYVMKYYENDEDSREIKNYEILESLGVPILKKYGVTSDSILIEHIDSRENFRLGTLDDLKNPKVAKAIAQWYKKLHNAGNRYNNLDNMYFEYDNLTVENLHFIMEKSNTGNLEFWEYLFKNLSELGTAISNLEYTFTYNDFFWTNMAVSYDYSKVIMFDYNLLGRGYRYADIRNVCSILSREATAVYLEEYGSISTREMVIDEAVSDLHTLIEAYSRDEFPAWAESSLNKLLSGKSHNKLEAALEMYKLEI